MISDRKYNKSWWQEEGTSFKKLQKVLGLKRLRMCLEMRLEV